MLRGKIVLVEGWCRYANVDVVLRTGAFVNATAYLRYCRSHRFLRLRCRLYWLRIQFLWRCTSGIHLLTWYFPPPLCPPSTHLLTDIPQALLTGYHLLAVGLAGFLFVPSARIYGKRHLYILGCVIIIISCIWAGATGPHYTSFLWARIFQGVGLAPFEALVNASVGDMYFVHERGVRMAVSTFFVFGGAFFTPVLVGLIADGIGAYAGRGGKGRGD
jgi:MFS family permease